MVAASCLTECVVIVTQGETLLLVFVFNDTAATEIYTLSLHDAVPIYVIMHEDIYRRAKLLLLSPCWLMGHIP